MSGQCAVRTRMNGSCHATLVHASNGITLHPDLVLATGPGDLPGVGVWTAKTGRFGSRSAQKPDPLTLGGPNPDLFPSIGGFCWVWIHPSVQISKSAVLVPHIWSHPNMLLVIVQHSDRLVTVHFRCLGCLHDHHK